MLEESTPRSSISWCCATATDSTTAGRYTYLLWYGPFALLGLGAGPRGAGVGARWKTIPQVALSASKPASADAAQQNSRTPNDRIRHCWPAVAGRLAPADPGAWAQAQAEEDHRSQRGPVPGTPGRTAGAAGSVKTAEQLQGSEAEAARELLAIPKGVEGHESRLWRCHYSPPSFVPVLGLGLYLLWRQRHRRTDPQFSLPPVSIEDMAHRLNAPPPRNRIR